MSSVLSTSTMKSPPPVVWVTGSLSGAAVSSAVWIGPGGSALTLARDAASGAAPWGLAAAGGTAAAAPARVAPLRNLRRSGSGSGRRLDMGFLRKRALFAACLLLTTIVSQRHGTVKGGRHARGLLSM